jgi:anti-sigma factor RsiW
VEISCREVIRELSGYIDSDLDDALRLRISEHLAGCAHCTAIYDGTRNVIRIVGDGRSFELPAGFSARLRQKIAIASNG